jgi:hypothetical protein
MEQFQEKERSWEVEKTKKAWREPRCEFFVNFPLFPSL